MTHASHPDLTVKGKRTCVPPSSALHTLLASWHFPLELPAHVIMLLHLTFAGEPGLHVGTAAPVVAAAAFVVVAGAVVAGTAGLSVFPVFAVVAGGAVVGAAVVHPLVSGASVTQGRQSGAAQRDRCGVSARNAKTLRDRC